MRFPKPPLQEGLSGILSSPSRGIVIWLQHMIADFHQGRMTPWQQQKLLALLRRLDELQPLFATLHLTWPDIRSMAMPYQEEAAAPALRPFS